LSNFDFDRPDIRLTVRAHSDTGQKRTQNQDSFLIADLSTPTADGGVMLASHDGVAGGVRGGEFQLGPKGALLMVSDGMGGAAAGDLASRIAAQSIYYELTTKWGADRAEVPGQFARRLRDALQEANARIHEAAEADPAYRGMGTTTTAVGVLDGFLYLAQVGDSRAYLIRDHTAIQLTRDQSVVQKLVDAGELTPEEAERSVHRNVILQALGTDTHVDVDLTYQEARRGDVVLICSDGLSGLVNAAELADAVAMGPDLAAACHRLIDLANARGGPDNITVVMARLEGSGLVEAAEGDAVGRKVYEPPEL
jgi:PPM family protein phosphatase